MTRKEAIARIEDHMIVHKMYEERSVKITEALQMAIKALEQVDLANAEAEYWKSIALEYKSLIDKLSQCFNPDSKIEDLLQS